MYRKLTAIAAFADFDHMFGAYSKKYIATERLDRCRSIAEFLADPCSRIAVIAARPDAKADTRTATAGRIGLL